MSNLEIVLKKSGELRVYCDLREVNNAIIRESCVLPKVDDTLQAVHGSKIDAKSSFFQLPFTEEFRYVTTLITPRGCYKFKRIPFGPGDASEVFQKTMEEILFEIDGVQKSIDDVIILVSTMAELVDRLRKVFDQCHARNLRLSRSKCEFALLRSRF